MDWATIVEVASRVVHERIAAPGETCNCGGASIARPSGDRVCPTCGRAWAIGDIKIEAPKP